MQRNDRWRDIDDVPTVRLSGRITSGRGQVKEHIARNPTTIRDALGEDVVEGSLNILLSRPVMFADDSAIRLHFVEGRPRLEWQGKMGEVDVWVHRWPAAPLHIVELLSTVHLRNRFGLSNGDRVHIEVRQCDLAPLPPLGLFTWVLFWLGRKRWEYNNDAYCARIQTRWSERFGATQLGTDQRFRDLLRAAANVLSRKLFGVRL